MQEPKLREKPLWACSFRILVKCQRWARVRSELSTAWSDCVSSVISICTMSFLVTYICVWIYVVSVKEKGIIFVYGTRCNKTCSQRLASLFIGGVCLIIWSNVAMYFVLVCGCSAPCCIVLKWKLYHEDSLHVLLVLLASYCFSFWSPINF